MKTRICKTWGLDASKVRLWDYWEETRLTLLNNEEATLVQAHLSTRQDILVEVQGADGEWPHDDEGEDEGDAEDDDEGEADEDEGEDE